VRQGHKGNNEGNLNGNGGRSSNGRPPCLDEEYPIHSCVVLFANNTSTQLDDNDTISKTTANWHSATMAPHVRGGGRLTKEKPDMITSITTYWGGVMGSVTRTLTAPFQSAGKRASSLFKSKERKYEEEIMEQLRTIKVQRVIVPNSTVLPAEVVLIAAKRSGVLGSPLKSELVQDLAQSLKRWYLRQGYLLHSVTGATLQPETATAEISVEEPTNHEVPLGISFYKEMVVDPESGELLTYRQYKERHQQRRTLGNEKIEKAALNTTFVPTKGWTKPSRLAAAMGMSPGQPFQWDHARWHKIVTSGLFGRILQAAPQPMGDGTWQMHIVATEAPSRHLEYGVGKSLYSGGWEGQLDFEHANLCGGGETLGVNVRRGTTEAIPSIRVKFSDGRLGLEGGYDVEAFSEFIGEDKDKLVDKNIDPASAPTSNTETPNSERLDDNSDVLFGRRGATFRVKNPIDTQTIRQSVASASVERTTTKTGLYETIGSTTLEVGPFLKELPMNARSNVDVSLTTGAKLGYSAVELDMAGDDVSEDAKATTSSTWSARSVVPFASVSATTRQLFPLLSSTTSRSLRAMAPKNGPSRPVLLALRHSVTASTSSAPKHMTMAIGASNRVRGATPNGRVSSAIHGTTEIRVPIQLPSRLQTGQPEDASLVLYGEWLLAVQDMSSPIVRKSSVGIGLRKSIQGFPLQYDVTYSNEGKIKAMFGLGKDFIF
jgi:hypothetical protein